MLRTISLTITLLVFISIIACSSSSSTDANYDPPADHTISKGDHMHKSGLTNPTENCISCHGSDLKGSDTAPSCYACHGKKW